jgi:hypothetical protein
MMPRATNFIANNKTIRERCVIMRAMGAHDINIGAPTHHDRFFAGDMALQHSAVSDIPNRYAKRKIRPGCRWGVRHDRLLMSAPPKRQANHMEARQIAAL